MNRVLRTLGCAFVAFNLLLSGAEDYLAGGSAIIGLIQIAGAFAWGWIAALRDESREVDA